MHLSQAIFLFFAAAIAGLLNSIAGGGSFVSFPALLFAGLPGVQANATNTVALWPGLAATVFTYLKRLHVPARLLLPLLVTSVAGGFAGAVLLIKTPQRTFEHAIPWLLLGGTLLFAFGPKMRAIGGRSEATDLRKISWLALAATSVLQFLVGTYGGYFGGGIGFVMMGMLAALGMSDIHSMNALRTLLAATINLVAVGTFIVAGAVLWPQCLVMILGSTAGGWTGGHYAQKADPKKLRYLVITVGLAMTAYFFATDYLRPA
ncbi:MAG: sulfite exporter TauE/SafE family protein [Actinomycetota bacterium]